MLFLPVFVLCFVIFIGLTVKLTDEVTRTAINYKYIFELVLLIALPIGFILFISMFGGSEQTDAGENGKITYMYLCALSAYFAITVILLLNSVSTKNKAKAGYNIPAFYITHMVLLNLISLSIASSIIVHFRNNGKIKNVACVAIVVSVAVLCVLCDVFYLKSKEFKDKSESYKKSLEIKCVNLVINPSVSGVVFRIVFCLIALVIYLSDIIKYAKIGKLSVTDFLTATFIFLIFFCMWLFPLVFKKPAHISNGMIIIKNLAWANKKIPISAVKNTQFGNVGNRAFVTFTVNKKVYKFIYDLSDEELLKSMLIPTSEN